MKKFRNLIYALATTVLLAFTNSCNELPTEMGYPLLYDTVSVEAVSSLDNPFIVDQANVHLRRGMLNSGAILLGKYAGMSSAALIRCDDLPDSLSYITADRIISSELSLKPVRWAMGDSTGSLSFNVYKVKKLWKVSATWDSLFKAPADYIDYSKSVGSFNSPIDLKDTIANVYTNIDKELTAEWLKFGNDTSKYINLGIALVPNENCNVIRKFAGQYVSQGDTVYYTELKVKYKDKNDKDTSIVIKAAMEYTVSDAPQPPANEFVLQGAAQYATQLGFDLSSLPDNIAIHSASLEIQLDKSRSIFSNFNTDSLRDKNITAIYLKNGAKDSIVVGDTLLSTMYGNLQNNFTTYKYSLFTYAVEYWLKNTNKKGTMLLTKIPVDKQFLTLDKYVFFGNDDPDPKKRPRLKIIYSRRPNFVKDAEKGGK